MAKTIVTTIDGVGSVEATNDLACFTLTVRAKNDSLEQAKVQAGEKTTNILKVLGDLKNKMVLEGDIVTSSLNYRLEHREGNERIPAGFQVVNTITFTVAVDDNLNEIYKTCLKLDTQMYRPVFSMRDREAHLEKALQNAAENVKEKLNKECILLGVSPDDLKIQNWSFSYEGNLSAMNFSSHTKSVYNGAGVYGATGPQGASGSVGPVGPVGPVATRLGTIYQEPLDYNIEPGSGTFTKAVRVYYVWANEIE